MVTSLAAPQAKGKILVDKIFGASAAAQKATAQFGKEKVINATIGAILDNEEKLVCLPTVEKVYRNIPINEVINYAPIAGIPDYLDAVLDAAFGLSRPDAYVRAIATSGGTGVLHNAIWNYSAVGDTVLTSDWFWGTYRVICHDAMRKLDTFTLFDDNRKFNLGAFESKVKELLKVQDNLVVILNTPAHNPTGYSIADSEWDDILSILNNIAKTTGKNIVIVVDVAYLDYAGDKEECRKFMAKFTHLPKNLLVIVAYSMSKGFTMYGQRTGAMIGISSDADVIQEFFNVNQYTSRATWSNINRGCMRVLATVYRDKQLLEQVEKERAYYYNMTKERADIFTKEAEAIGLNMLPYVAGFFLSIPANDSDAVCERLHDDNIFAVPLAKGVRIAVCAVPAHKISGMAAKVAKAMSEIER